MPPAHVTSLLEVQYYYLPQTIKTNPIWQFYLLLVRFPVVIMSLCASHQSEVFSYVLTFIQGMYSLNKKVPRETPTSCFTIDVQHDIPQWHRTSTAIRDLMWPLNPVCRELIRLGIYVCAWDHRLGERLRYCGEEQAPEGSFQPTNALSSVPGETSSTWPVFMCWKKRKNKRAAASSTHFLLTNCSYLSHILPSFSLLSCTVSEHHTQIIMFIKYVSAPYSSKLD